MADGSIKIKTRIDNSESEKDLNELEKMCDRTAKNVEKTNAKITVSTEADDGVSSKSKSKWLSVTNDSSLKKAQSRLQAIREEIAKIEADTNKDLSLAVTDEQAAQVLELESRLTKELNAEYDHLIQQVGKYQQAKQDAVNEKLNDKQIRDNFNSASKELSTEAGSSAFLSKIQTQEQYNAALTTTKARITEIEASARRIANEKGVDVNSLLQANSEYQKLSSRLRILKAHQGEFRKSATKSFDGARKAANRFANSIQGGIKKMGKFALAAFGIRSAYMAVRQVVSGYIADNEELKNSFEGLKGAIGEMFGPAIEKVISLLKIAIGYVLAFIKALTGVDYAARYNEKALKKQTSATKDLTKAQRQSASFDEQNKLNDPSSSSGGSVPTFDATIGDVSFEFLEKMKSQILNDDWYGAGATLAQTLMDGIEGTDWEGFGYKLGDIIARICEFALGFITNIDPATLLEKVNELLIGIFDSFSASLQRLDWKEIGKKILDLILVGLAFTNPVTAILTLMLSPKGSEVTKSASEFIGSLVGGLCAAIVGMAQRIGDIGKQIFSTIKDHFDKYVDWDSTPSDIIEGLFKGILAALSSIGTWIYENIWVPFRDGFKKAFGIASPSKKMKEFGAFLIDGLKEGIGNVWSKVKEKFDALLTKLSAWKDSLKTKAKEAGTAFVDGMKNGLNTLKEKLKSPINSVITMVENAINWIIGKLNKLSWTIPDWVPSIGGKKFGFNMSTVKIPRLAKGGIVSNIGKGVPLIAGEAGREAILPLDTNTEWMDILVEKISSGNITIPIYLDGKLIGKYVIDLQKRQAFASNGG